MINKKIKIGQFQICIEWKPKSIIGRFGGGWNWHIGIQWSGSTFGGNELITMKNIIKRFIAGWKATNNKRYAGFWVDRKKPVSDIMRIIIIATNQEQKNALFEWLGDYVDNLK